MRRRVMVIAGFVLGALLFGALGGVGAVILTTPAAAAVRAPNRATTSLGSSFTVQGRLEDGGGLADDLYDFELRLFDAEMAGTQVGSTQIIDDITVIDGLFTLVPDFGSVYNGQELWLEISVRPGASTGAFTLLSPRHALTGAPYALGLRPGVLVDTDDAANDPYILNLINDSASVEGDVIKAYSTNGEGIEGYSTGGSVADSGIYGQSNGTGTLDAGVRGYTFGAGPGLYGQGVGDYTTSYGIRGISSSTHGVYGTTSSGSTAFFGGWFSGEKGVFGNAESSGGDGTYGYCASGSACWGARGSSVNSYGVQGNTSRSDQMYGVHTSDRMYAGAGYTSVSGFSIIVQNGGSTALEIGDVVAVSGITEAFEDAPTPLMQVSRASAATAGSVVGVVETALRIEMISKPGAVYEQQVIADPEGEEDDLQWLVAEETVEENAVHEAVDGPAEPGMYLVIRVQGLAQVRVDAAPGAITKGSPLVAGDGGSVLSGEAAAVQGLSENALVIGQALESLPDGEGLIWVLVSPR